MGRRGPAPTPTNILRLRGSKLYGREGVDGPTGIPDPPDWLAEDAEASRAWQELRPLLTEMGVLTRIDRNVLARYCRTWSRWREAEKFLDAHGTTYALKDESGRVRCMMQFPQVAIAHKLCQQLTRMEQELGMTPSARTRINAATQATSQSNKSRFFSPQARA